MMTVAVVDDEVTARNMVARILTKAGYSVETFPTGLSFLKKMKADPFDIVFLDLKLPDLNGMEVLHRIKDIQQKTEVIMVTGHGSIENAVEATKEGAFHYLAKPCRSHDLHLMANRASEKIGLHKENSRLKAHIGDSSLLPGFIGTSKAMQTIFELINKVAQVNCNVLLEAETGTGKQLTAHAIHDLGPNPKAPFVYFNCGSFTEDLICNELFGHEKDAFTGATTRKIGLFEFASGGTVLLDEIGEMPLSGQVRLLHVLQERKLLRVGGVEPIPINIRIIASTNKDLKQLIKEEKFREDLYYRLNVVTIHLPRLCKRKDDIPLLIHHFIAKSNKAFAKDIKGVSSKTLDILMKYNFPGNVRELENIIQHAAALTEGDKLIPEDLPARLLKTQSLEEIEEELPSLEDIEKNYISKVLSMTGNNIKTACVILKMPRTTLWRKMKKYGLSSSSDNKGH